MKNYFRLGALVLAVSLYSCGGAEEGNNDPALSNPNNPNAAAAVESTETAAEKEVPPSERIDLTSKGVGPITDAKVDLSAPIDEALVAKGKEVYDMNCTACHKVDQKFVGPAQAGIMNRRTPEWIMNMIMDPEGMVQNDPLAKELLMEFNGSPMSNQGITEDQARALVEYFRTL